VPTYEYHCKTCGKNFEKFQSIKAEPLKHCECGQSGEVDRLIGTGGGIIFKGSGFYETDYKRSAKPSESSKSDKKSEGTTAAPAATPAPANSPQATPKS
jgi:putative FmdB family regulatory protein